MGNELLIMHLFFISIFPFLLFFMSNLYTFFFSNNGRNMNSREFYECGFKTMSDNNVVIDIHYIIFGLMFLIFEMEIIIFVPMLINYLGYSYMYMLLIFFSFFIILLSFFYEWDNFGFVLTFN